MTSLGRASPLLVLRAIEASKLLNRRLDDGAEESCTTYLTSDGGKSGKVATI